MNLRKEIEKLIYWYIPAIMITYFVGTVVTAQVKQINGITPLLSYGFLGSTLLLNHMHSIVVAIWLYFLAKKMKQRYVLWTLFGLVAHLFAAVIYLVIHLLEEKKINMLISNKDEETNSLS
jgi:hypothetical protein